MERIAESWLHSDTELLIIECVLWCSTRLWVCVSVAECLLTGVIWSSGWSCCLSSLFSSTMTFVWGIISLAEEDLLPVDTKLWATDRALWTWAWISNAGYLLVSIMWSCGRSCDSRILLSISMDSILSLTTVGGNRVLLCLCSDLLVTGGVLWFRDWTEGGGCGCGGSLGLSSVTVWGCGCGGSKRLSCVTVCFFAAVGEMEGVGLYSLWVLFLTISRHAFTKFRSLSKILPVEDKPGMKSGWLGLGW